ncbi:MAG: retroviral-like aspartic protease family protein [Nitrososphaerales archaeon]
MGFVKVKCWFGSAGQKTVKEVDFLTDTGAFYTMIPPQLAKELGIKSVVTTKLMLANKRVAEAGISLAYVKILEREGIFNIAIMDVPEPLLGVSTLEGLSVRVDSTTGEVEYSRSYGLAVL